LPLGYTARGPLPRLCPRAEGGRCCVGLFGGGLAVSVGLVGGALSCLLVWWQQARDRRWLAATLAAVGLIALYWLLDVLVKTEVEADREEIQARIQAMSDAVKKRDAKALFDNLADDFRSPGGRNKDQYREAVLRYVND